MAFIGIEPNTTEDNIVGDITPQLGGDLDLNTYGLKTNGVVALSIDNSQNATFAGTVDATSYTGSGAALTSLTAANISTGSLAANVLPYVTASAAASAYKIMFAQTTLDASGNHKALIDSGTGEFVYNPSTNTVTATTFAGALSGNATTATTAGTVTTAAQPTITSVGTLTGFTSTGIDDNASATRVVLTNNAVQVGDLSSDTLFSIYRGRTDSYLYLSAGSDANSGANFVFCGEASVVAPGRLNLRQGTTSRLVIDTTTGDADIVLYDKAGVAALTVDGATGSVGINTAASATHDLSIQADSNSITDYSINLINDAGNASCGYGAYGISNGHTFGGIDFHITAGGFFNLQSVSDDIILAKNDGNAALTVNGGTGITTFTAPPVVASTVPSLTLKDTDATKDVGGHHAIVYFKDSAGTNTAQVGFYTGGQDFNIMNHNLTGGIGFYVNDGVGGVALKLRFDDESGGGDIDFYDNADAKALVIDGATGNTTIEKDMVIKGNIHTSNDTSFTYYTGGTSTTTGGNMLVYGTSHATQPSRIVFKQDNVVRFDISNTANGDVSIRNSAGTSVFEVDGPSGQIQVNNATDVAVLSILPTHATYAKNVIQPQVTRAATNAYSFLTCYSSAGADAEYRLYGDGTAVQDGGTAWGTPADYAEFFETTDGQDISIGTSVILDGGKVRPALPSDPTSQILGVIRPKNGDGSIIANSAELRWNRKYLSDDQDNKLLEAYTVIEWEEIIPAVTELQKQQVTIEETKNESTVKMVDGVATLVNELVTVKIPQFTEHEVLNELGEPVLDENNIQLIYREPIMEDVEVEIESAKTELRSYESDKVPANVTVPAAAVTKTHDDEGNLLDRRVLNPDYDPNFEYIPRKDRPEWVVVGLVGQVKVTVGQPSGDRWIKMRDVNETTEEWMVR